MLKITIWIKTDGVTLGRRDQETYIQSFAHHCGGLTYRHPEDPQTPTEESKD